MKTVIASVICAALMGPGQGTMAAGLVQNSAGLKRVEVDRNKNGRSDTFQYWDGTRLVRVEIDEDEDGRIDQWEHRGANNTLARLGSSSKGDGVEDMWSYFDAANLLLKVELDTDRDGMVDKRDSFAASPASKDLRTLVTIEIGLDQSGQPATRLHYRPDGSFDRVEKIRQ